MSDEIVHPPRSQGPHAGQRGVTRLAPSPTGALHLGNARTFLINWALAEQHGWRVLMRIEDLDGPRVRPGAAESCLETLAWLGLGWEPDVLTQSADLSPYAEAMQRLAALGRAFPSDLTRREIEAATSAPQEGAAGEVRFPPELRPEIESVAFDRPERGWRFVVEPGVVRFADRFAGVSAHEPAAEVGDFIVWTKARTPAYQLAVVVDDDRQGVTQIVRGDDLLPSTARQLQLMQALGISSRPEYTHLPLVIGPDGKRLAKRHGDTRLLSYRTRGIPAERIIGLIASWSGVLPAGSPEEMSAREFAGSFRLERVPPEAVRFTSEDDRWLTRT